jgi:acetolactate synthase-1/2/3 large subunit
VFQQRGVKLADAKRANDERLRQAATNAWDASPVSTARVAAELWAQIKNEDWSLVSNYYSEAGVWPRRLWNFTKSYQWPGHAGGGGIGYGAPSSVGAALANKKYGRLQSAFKPTAT